MATHKSAIKRHRQSLKRNARNRAVKAEIKTLTKRLGTASKEETPALLKKVQSKLAKAGQARVIHKKNAGKRISNAVKLAAARQ
ncbi:MAG: 30S ribosomal protein S20 [Deltaproteobacteria bacterium]|nr:30S ribosomal protein S20 [Deltaproteobacteria bacterium]